VIDDGSVETNHFGLQKYQSQLILTLSKNLDNDLRILNKIRKENQKVIDLIFLEHNNVATNTSSLLEMDVAHENSNNNVAHYNEKYHNTRKSKAQADSIEFSPTVGIKQKKVELSPNKRKKAKPLKIKHILNSNNSSINSIDDKSINYVYDNIIEGSSTDDDDNDGVISYDHSSIILQSDDSSSYFNSYIFYYNSISKINNNYNEFVKQLKDIGPLIFNEFICSVKEKIRVQWYMFDFYCDNLFNIDPTELYSAIVNIIVVENYTNESYALLMPILTKKVVEYIMNVNHEKDKLLFDKDEVLLNQSTIYLDQFIRKESDFIDVIKYFIVEENMVYDEKEKRNKARALVVEMKYKYVKLINQNLNLIEHRMRGYIASEKLYNFNTCLCEIYKLEVKEEL
jgi:hypothetical protein